MRLSPLIIALFFALLPSYSPAFVDNTNPPTASSVHPRDTAASLNQALAQIQLESQDWGDANPENVKAVLESVLQAVKPYSTGRQLGTIIIKNDDAGPMSTYQKGPNGEYIVLLDVKGRLWSKLAYQFAHESCHLLSNYEKAPSNATGQQWFEEAICDAFSLHVLGDLAEQWKKNPPYDNWTDYAENFTEYRDNALSEPHRKLPVNTSLAAWFSQNREALVKDPYAQERQLSEVAGKQLYNLFEQDSSNWAAINYLNLVDADQPQSFDRYLRHWISQTPEDFRGAVENIYRKFLPMD